MSAEIRPTPIRKAISRLRWRLRAQTGLRWGILGAIIGAAALLIGVTLHETWLLPTHTWQYFAYGSVAVVGLGVLAGLLRRWDAIGLAQRLDRANDLKDRLGTALVLLDKPAEERTDFEDAQIRDAMAHSASVEHKTAAPWTFPREVAWVALLLAGAWGATFLEVGPPAQDRDALRPVYFADGSALPMPQKLAGPPPVAPYEPEVIEEVKVDVQEVIDENERTLAPLAKNDAKANEFVEKLNKTLQNLAEGKLSDRELAKEAGDLEESLQDMAGTAEEQKNHEEFAKALEEVAKEIEKQADKKIKDKEVKKEVKALAKALEERRYEDAAKKLEKLLDMFNKLSPKEQKRLAKMFEHLAKKYQSKLSRALNKMKNERDRLNKKKDGKGGLNKRERNRLNKLNKQLERLSKKYDKQSNERKKQLDKLSREMKNLANKMNRQRKQKGQKGQKGQKNKRNQAEQRKSRLSKKEMKQLSEMMKRMSKQQRRNRLKRQGKMRMADLKELMKRRRGMGKGRKKLERLARGKKGGKGPGKLGKMQQGRRSGDTKRKGVEWAKVNRPSETKTSRRGAKDGDGAGHGRDRMLSGRETDLKGAKTKEDFVNGQKGNGPSRKAILYGAATKGTRVKGYGDVHVDYSMRAARHMAKEEIPPGYREYVEEYFRLIRKR